MSGPLPLHLFDYELPPELIAQEPARPRDASRLMVLPKTGGHVEHRRFLELPTLLGPGDLLVVNRTQVIPARLRLRRETGGKVEALLVKPLDGPVATARRWEALGKPGDAFKAGKVLIASDGARLQVESREGATSVLTAEEPLLAVLERLGEVPLPPYIERAQGPSTTDRDDYQTLFAREPGAVAAPTASLHFTERVLAALRERGVALAEVVLHVGLGTFLPIRDEHAGDVRGHSMHAEAYDVPEETARAIERAERVIAVGTTSARALETWGATGQARGESRLFIVPGYELRVIDGLLTNFHLPKSTLLMLVSALAGRERILAAYAEAVRERYRFFSYGDAMLIS